MRHTFLVALSFANICYLRVWGEILTYRPWDTYLMTTPPRPVGKPRSPDGAAGPTHPPRHRLTRSSPKASRATPGETARAAIPR